jgi:hypothetical protein
MFHVEQSAPVAVGAVPLTLLLYVGRLVAIVIGRTNEVFHVKQWLDPKAKRGSGERLQSTLPERVDVRRNSEMMR